MPEPNWAGRDTATGGGAGGTTTEPVTLTPTDPEAVPLTLQPADGATANQTDLIEVYNDTGNLLGWWDASGGFSTKITGTLTTIRCTGSSITIRFDGSPGGQIVIDAGGVQICSSTFTVTNANRLGFYGVGAVAQPAHPTDLTGVIAALTALGLVAA